MRLRIAILLGRLIFSLTRRLNIGGGSAAPGLYALKVDPNLVSKLSQKISANIIITGTNGKTTTSKMIAHFAKTQGLQVIRNHTGSNLERGIASALIHHSQLSTLNSFDLGIWELDEAAFNSVAPKLNPKIVVFLNVFRDQLDRYGEIDTVIKGWAETLKKLPIRPSSGGKNTIVLVNGDDSNTKKLKSYFKGEVFEFGVQNYKIVGEGIQHKKEQENLDFEAKNVKLNGLNGSSFNLSKFNGRKILKINLPQPGIYNIYNFLAASAVAEILKFNSKNMVSSIKTFTPAFGRMEKFSFPPGEWERGLSGYIFLIKNPAGATQVFQTIAPQIKTQDRLLIALNDKIADGTDVSWIWDIALEQFQIVRKDEFSNEKPNFKFQILASGTRAYDLAVRLKYAGFNPKQVRIEQDVKKALIRAQGGLKGRLFILPTYTAMLELQSILAKLGVKKNYWEELD